MGFCGGEGGEGGFCYNNPVVHAIGDQATGSIPSSYRH